ncbi:unnamed protein product, partial [marine sediment metagenome]
MTILRTKKTWRRDTPEAARPSSVRLTPEERANTKRALGFLRARAGSWRALAVAMGQPFSRMAKAVQKGRPVTARMAILVARHARVPVEDVLAGRWPAEGV